jgi:hypothetical protein
MVNYPSTPCGSIKLQKLEHLLRCSRKIAELTLNSTVFFGAEFVELRMFSNTELKKRERSSSEHSLNTYCY